MPLPLLWLGAAAASIFAVKELADDRKEQQRKRRYSRDAESYSMLKRHESPIATYPTDLSFGAHLRWRQSAARVAHSSTSCPTCVGCA